MKALDANVLEWESDESFGQAYSSDTSFSDDLSEKPETLFVKEEIAEKSEEESEYSKDSTQEENYMNEIKKKQVRVIDIEHCPEIKTEKILHNQGQKADFYKQTKKLLSQNISDYVKTKNSKPLAHFVHKQE